ncbi:MAG: TonB family protein [Bacteroidales bacterium]|nr:TonB family protein [Bacteroidales bacterium]
MKLLKYISRKTTYLSFTLIFLLNTVFCFNQEAEQKDKTLSPYFVVINRDSETDQLPLKSTAADVTISGVIADVTIKQIYKNEGKTTLEAIYVFPASTQAAVYAMTMKIGEREIEAIVQEKDLARKQYELAKNEGKTASLLEQKRPNVFQMNIGNILPGDVIEVKLSYTELLVPKSGVYEFVYPTVVGPRYANSLTDPMEDSWVANPYLEENKPPTYTFLFSAKISTGIPVKDIQSPSHNIQVQYNNKSTAQIKLQDTDKYKGNKDFILQYRLAGGAIEDGLMLYKGKDENFFLAMVQPPRQVTSEFIPPREYIFIVDVSGSMNGFPLTVSKSLMKDLLAGLRPQDKFNVILFAGASSMYAPQSLSGSETNIKLAMEHINKQSGGGGTELLPALQKALNLPKEEDISRILVILTDGYVSVEREAFQLIRQNMGKANFFAFGIGSSVNRYIIEGIAKSGNGEPFVVTNQNESRKIADQFKKYVASPVLTNIQISFNGFNAAQILPERYPDVFAERPLIISGKYSGEAKGNITITGYSGAGKFSSVIRVADYKEAVDQNALRYLWARTKLQYIDDYSSGETAENMDDFKTEILEIGLKYNLLTRFTSFIAIDSEIRNPDGSITRVKQPLPLPEGVNNYAVGSPMYLTGKKSSPTGAIKSINLNIVADEEFEISEEKDITKPEFFTVEKAAEYTGGMEAFKKFILANIQYPEKLKTSGISGTVYIQFSIGIDGSVSDVKVLRGLHPLLDQEAIRVIKLSAKWTPAQQGGKPVKTTLTVPVQFRLN